MRHIVTSQGTVRVDRPWEEVSAGIVKIENALSGFGNPDFMSPWWWSLWVTRYIREMEADTIDSLVDELKTITSHEEVMSRIGEELEKLEGDELEEAVSSMIDHIHHSFGGKTYEKEGVQENKEEKKAVLESQEG